MEIKTIYYLILNEVQEKHPQTLPITAKEKQYLNELIQTNFYISITLNEVNQIYKNFINYLSYFKEV